MRSLHGSTSATGIVGLLAFVAALAGLVSAGSVGTAYAQAEKAASSAQSAAPKGAQQAGASAGTSAAGAQPVGRPQESVWDAVASHPRVATAGAFALAVFISGMAFVLYRSTQQPQRPFILELGPSFFFWLEMSYVALLLVMALVYAAVYKGARPLLIGDTLPIAVPWFGAVGAVMISLEGVFLRNQDWQEKYNYWHIGRPLFGAVLGIVAFFLYVVIVAASGSPPKFFQPNAEVLPQDVIIFYMVAFVVGYREETFRELIKRVIDLILKPATQPSATPELTFKAEGGAVSRVALKPTVPNKTSHLTVEVQNTGGTPLVAPKVSLTATARTPAGTFGIANDHVTDSGELAEGEARSVDVTFTPPAAGSFSGVLRVAGANFPAAKAIRVTGTAHK